MLSITSVRTVTFPLVVHICSLSSRPLQGLLLFLFYLIVIILLILSVVSDVKDFYF